MPVGDRLRLELTLPDTDRPIDLLAEVRWLRDEGVVRADMGLPTGMGLRFLELSAPAHEAINAFLDRRETLFYDDE